VRIVRKGVICGHAFGANPTPSGKLVMHMHLAMRRLPHAIRDVLDDQI
jgi:hypothetical protein